MRQEAGVCALPSWPFIVVRVMWLTLHGVWTRKMRFRDSGSSSGHHDLHIRKRCDSNLRTFALVIFSRCLTCWFLPWPQRELYHPNPHAAFFPCNEPWVIFPFTAYFLQSLHSHLDQDKSSVMSRAATHGTAVALSRGWVTVLLSAWVSDGIPAVTCLKAKVLNQWSWAIVSFEIKNGWAGS